MTRFATELRNFVCAGCSEGFQIAETTPFVVFVLGPVSCRKAQDKCFLEYCMKEEKSMVIGKWVEL